VLSSFDSGWSALSSDGQSIGLRIRKVRGPIPSGRTTLARRADLNWCLCARECAREPPSRILEIGLTHDVVPVEHGASLVTRNSHGDTLNNTPVDHIRHGCAAMADSAGYAAINPGQWSHLSGQIQSFGDRRRDAESDGCP
jgi:hypothetical protein